MADMETQLALKGTGFISFEPDAHHAYMVFLEKIQQGNGLCVTRDHPVDIHEKYGALFETHWLSQRNLKKNETVYDVLQNQVKAFVGKKENPAVLLDRTDYLIQRFGFDRLLEFLYEMRELMIDNLGTLILYVNPHILDERQKQLLRLELKPLPRPEEFDQIRLAKDLFDILELVKESEQKISFKTICKALDITKATARKRIYDLQSKSLIEIRKDGRSKIVELTDAGKAIV